ncbi:transposase [Apiospora phragmitis]|uniref:Transposase n=1 Tax=Apiospora phragmitis TaxID=2905665 RepID=A0ABR1X581_9PEZI
MDYRPAGSGASSNARPIFGSFKNRSIRKKQPGSKAWTSFIEYISVLGRTIPPLVIFKVFIPNTAPEDPSEYRLLVVDGYGSHITTDFIYLCFLYRIRLLFLPPYTFYVLQPLDLAVFSPLKTAYRKVLGNINQFSNLTVIGKRYFL